MPSLAKAQHQCQSSGTQENPTGNRFVNRKRTNDNPNNKPEGDTRHISNRLIAPRNVVDDLDCKVSQESENNIETTVNRESERQGKKEKGENKRKRDWNATRSDRAILFDWVSPILFDVVNIVDQVRRRRRKAHRKEGKKHRLKVARYRPAFDENEGGEDENILRPLLNPHNPNQIGE